MQVLYFYKLFLHITADIFSAGYSGPIFHIPIIKRLTLKSKFFISKPLSENCLPPSCMMRRIINQSAYKEGSSIFKN